ncbi:MAG: hypothetical protein ACREGI_04860, partial [Candidatus Levyibacteriota bacterium]
MPFGWGRSREMEGNPQPAQAGRLGRRRLLRLGVGGGVLGITLGGLYTISRETQLFTNALNWLGNKKDQAGLYEKVQGFLNPDDRIENYLCTFENATYPSSQILNNVQIGIGDSIQG